jgi:L-cysteine S-thiosulfotransferase
VRLAAALAIVMLAAPAWAEAPLALEGSAAPSPWQRYPGWNKTRWDNYNSLDHPTVTPPPGREIAIQSVAGDPQKGQQLAFERSRGGGCLACHVMGPKTLETPGNVGPDLSEIGKAGRTDQWLYNQVFDARVYNPKSVMPPWGKHGFYSDGEIRDMVAFLKTLKAPARFTNPLDVPEKRPFPVEDRYAVDPFVNPGA